MRRELLLIGEMIEAAEQARALVSGIDLDALTADRQRRDALLWNFTVLGEAATQLAPDIKDRFPEIPWAQPSRLRNRRAPRVLVDRPGGAPHHGIRPAACVRRSAT